MYNFKYSLEEVCEEEEVEVPVIWYLTLVSEIMRGTPGLIILQNRVDVIKLLHLILRLKSKDAFNVCFDKLSFVNV